MAVQINARQGLSPREAGEVRALQAACEEADGLDLKLTVRERAEGEVPGQFLARSEGLLVGYCGVDAGHDAEVCGMVHAAYRGQGTGRALLERSLGAAAAMGHSSALVICEDASRLAMEWLKRRGSALDSTELRMVVRLKDRPALVNPHPGLRLARASEADRAALVTLLGQGFTHISDEMLQSMLGRLDPNQEDTLVARNGTDLVATLRIYTTPSRSMVYGLVVDESLRGRGYGRAAMLAALEMLGGRGEREVSLEVLPDNQPAVRLYRSLGFRTSTTYRYLRTAATGP